MDTPYDAAEPLAHLGGRLATGLREVTGDLGVLDGSGRWAVVVTYEGEVTCARFADWRPVPLPEAPSWQGPEHRSWVSSLDPKSYVAAVEEIRVRIAAGTVYQVNLCRVLAAELQGEPDLLPLARRLAQRHDARYASVIRLPEVGVNVTSASPELFLRRRGLRVVSAPIKGTGRSAEDISEKDVAENIMIVDLVRNDLSRVCTTGTIAVEGLLSRRTYPGLVHMVSTVTGRLEPGRGWPDLVEATFPPGSVTGAPKSTAVMTIADLEPVLRGPYCGAIGWVDADTGEGELAVGIRTFWAEEGSLRFGTGAGITWGSDPDQEWMETELKAGRLIGLASASGEGGR